MGYVILLHLYELCNTAISALKFTCFFSGSWEGGCSISIYISGRSISITGFSEQLYAPYFAISFRKGALRPEINASCVAPKSMREFGYAGIIHYVDCPRAAAQQHLLSYLLQLRVQCFASVIPTQ